MEGSTVIEVASLSKRYGEKLAVDGLDFVVRPGIVTGFLGPNGSGNPVTGLRHSFLALRTPRTSTSRGTSPSMMPGPIARTGGLWRSLPGCLVFVFRLGRDDEVDSREVGAVPVDVAGQQPVPGNGGVRADVEVRHRGPFLPSAAAVLQECLACGEAGEVGQRLALVSVGRQQFLHFLDSLVADGDLGVDERVDHRPAGIDGSRDLRG